MNQDKLNRVEKIINSYINGELYRLELEDKLDVEFSNQHSYNVAKSMIDDFPRKEDRSYLFNDTALRIAKCLLLFFDE